MLSIVERGGGGGGKRLLVERANAHGGKNGVTGMAQIRVEETLPGVGACGTWPVGTDGRWKLSLHGSQNSGVKLHDYVRLNSHVISNG